MKEHKEFTFGWFIVVIIVPIQVFVTFAYAYNLGDRPLNHIAFIVVNGVFVVKAGN
jgi:hypothetical protein